MSSVIFLKAKKNPYFLVLLWPGQRQYDDLWKTKKNYLRIFVVVECSLMKKKGICKFLETKLFLRPL